MITVLCWMTCPTSTAELPVMMSLLCSPAGHKNRKCIVSWQQPREESITKWHFGCWMCTSSLPFSLLPCFYDSKVKNILDFFNFPNIWVILNAIVVVLLLVLFHVYLSVCFVDVLFFALRALVATKVLMEFYCLIVVALRIIMCKIMALVLLGFFPISFYFEHFSPV